MPLIIPEKICPDCGRDLRCVFTGSNIYLAHTGEVHAADLFMCFRCLTFHAFGVNLAPLKHWKDTDQGRVEFTPNPDVVIAGKIEIEPYGEGSPFAYVKGDVIPLPSAQKYMVEKCFHAAEISAYLAVAPSSSRASWRAEKKEAGGG